MANANHSAATLELLGQPVRVSKTGISWRNPDDGRLRRIGSTRIEAESTLVAWMQDRASFFRPPIPKKKRVPKPPKATKRGAVEKMYQVAYARAKARSTKSGRPIMSMDEFKSMVERARGACEVSGIAFSTVRSPEHTKAMWAPSIDRLDCRLGYEFNNCRLVCVAVNLAINDFGASVLMKIAHAVLRRERKRRALERATA